MASVLEYLQGRGQVFTVIPHPRVPPADGRPRASHIPKELTVKTVVAMTKDGMAVLVIPAARRLALELLPDALGDPNARLATERELERQFPEYELGALPPLSMLLLAPLFVDPAVVERSEVVFCAGRRDVSIRMTTSDLFGNDPVVIAPLTEESRVGAGAS
jgi:Ala-tRNA(Pro) deacylase